MAIIAKFIKRVLIVLILLFVAFHLMIAGLLAVWKTQPIDNSMFMLLHRLSGGSVTQTWVEYDHIAKSAKQAAIASEDAKFVTHDGFDMQGIEVAMKKNESTGTVSAGGSTITQQLAKNLFLTPHRSYVRKGEEAIITVMIENIWDKQRILTAYLNVAEFGDGIYGIEAAAQHYFGKPASKLSQSESALLISMLPNPKYYEQHQDAKRLRNKQRIIQKRMPSAALP
ncbi:monofunctional biosynthetic peptidoglycan transglycosylase [Psychrobacter sp. I-STPA10]|uniref:monofunctional biosynthetic peptidoglycan transglycosylase n=1 Tax=Psychrobacter sp. I-STPA10 TaxID=2585769 RepID=UPI001E444844|nr:monofunctional biosynthetic peptidoglycan transglycosylase [Psychrobacter sp. I-STPA10]